MQKRQTKKKEPTLKVERSKEKELTPEQELVRESKLNALRAEKIVETLKSSGHVLNPQADLLEYTRLLGEKLEKDLSYLVGIKELDTFRREVLDKVE